MPVLVVVLVIAFLLVPETAYAWGPFAHLEFARAVLAEPALLPPGVAALLGAHAMDFAYGSIAADIVVAKNLASHLRHAHNWQNVLRLWHQARTDGQRAFALGYLSHLAADTVAHNYYIPLKLVETYPARFLSHVYWELRFDEWARPGVRETVERLKHMRFPDNDALHERHIAGTLFGFRANKLIFDSVFVFQSLEQWRRTAERLAERSPWGVTENERAELTALSVARIRDYLADPTGSAVMQIDARGTVALARARAIRRDLRRLMRRGAVTPADVATVRDHFRGAFRAAVTEAFVAPGMVALVQRLQQGDPARVAQGRRLPVAARVKAFGGRLLRREPPSPPSSSPVAALAAPAARFLRLLGRRPR